MNCGNKRIFVSGIGTGVGKTVCAAILAESLEADYWKPIQSGDLENSDSRRVSLLAPDRTVHPEAYRLTRPMSPHAAAAKDGVRIDLSGLKPPETSRPLVIEGAGGLMVPLNEECLMIDFISHLRAAVVLVSRSYLGSINHTLLSLEVLKQREIPLAGIIFNGASAPESEEYILNYSKAPVLGRIREEPRIDAGVISKYAAGMRKALWSFL